MAGNGTGEVTSTSAARIRASFKGVDSWWTVLVVDPVAARVLPWLVRPWITANVLTISAGIVGVASGFFFLGGMPIVGALLFELRFLLDCLDGKLARLTGTGTRFGQFLDHAVDLVVGSWAYAALCLWLASEGAFPASLALLPVVIVRLWSWTNDQQIVARRDTARSGIPAAASGTAAEPRHSRRHRLTRYPSSVEANTVALFLAPLTGNPTVIAAAVWFVLAAFYLPSLCRNLYLTAVVLRR